MIEKGLKKLVRHTSPQIVVIEDNEQFRGLLERSLQAEGFQVSGAANGKSGLALLSKKDFDLVILDLGLPDRPGEQVCREIRRTPATRGIPILMITGRAAEGTSVRALDSGADDFLAKPFELTEFLAHVRALLRRPREYISGDAVIQSGRLRIDVGARRIEFRGRAIRKLAPKEFELLRQLALNGPNVIDKNTLALKVWGLPLDQLHQRTLDVHIRRVRKKLGPSAAVCLQTVPAVGYQWIDE